MISTRKCLPSTVTRRSQTNKSKFSNHGSIRAHRLSNIGRSFLRVDLQFPTSMSKESAMPLTLSFARKLSKTQPLPFRPCETRDARAATFYRSCWPATNAGSSRRVDEKNSRTQINSKHTMSRSFRNCCNRSITVSVGRESGWTRLATRTPMVTKKDKPRESWFYRDWVIRSLNDDRPYDDFIIRQIAGDLIPGARQSDRVATGFSAQFDGQ